MELSLVTVAFDPERRAFPRAPLAAIKGEILNVVEHFFHFDGVPHLLLIVHHRAGEEEAVQAASRRRRKPPPEDLSAEETVRFERLRAWRKGRAAADGVPVYVVFSNRELAGIARARPASRAALAAVEGVGDAKAGRYGKEILRLLAPATVTAAPEDGEAPSENGEASSGNGEASPENGEAPSAPAPAVNDTSDT